MDTLRVSATDIDALHRYQNDEEAELSDLLAQLRRETPPTEAMLAGTALHKALEVASSGEFETLSSDGYSFTFDADVEIDLPEIRELKATREYCLNGCIVTLVGKVDAVHGKRVDDHKFTSRYDAERYMSSYQWRIYLEIFGADEFRWNIFEGRETDQKTYRIHASHSLAMHRYPGISSDVERAISDFLSFARAHLPERVGKESQAVLNLMAG